jgi:hypothetical protein
MLLHLLDLGAEFAGFLHLELELLYLLELQFLHPSLMCLCLHYLLLQDSVLGFLLHPQVLYLCVYESLALVLMLYLDTQIYTYFSLNFSSSLIFLIWAIYYFLTPCSMILSSEAASFAAYSDFSYFRSELPW